MALYPTHDLALRFDATGSSCDLVIADGDLVLDDTPATPMIVSLGTDRRARADDVLPGDAAPLTTPNTWNPRRGWVGDCLDAAGRRIGTRLWLLSREHDTDEVRARAESYTREALAWAGDEMDLTPEIEVSWLRAGILKIRAFLDGRAVTVTRKVA